MPSGDSKDDLRLQRTAFMCSTILEPQAEEEERQLPSDYSSPKTSLAQFYSQIRLSPIDVGKSVIRSHT